LFTMPFCRHSAPTELYTLSLHDALPISQPVKYRPPSRSKLTPAQVREIRARWAAGGVTQAQLAEEYGVHLKHMQHIVRGRAWKGDRKSTRLNSSHVKISYAVFCLKKKRK